ncbi:hypothetical protein L0Y65_00040 [Candidatus Micrarchaeota archaeon]|nr:hypothetical protein [Candidatus Micrarchaeota archaeon]
MDGKNNLIDMAYSGLWALFLFIVAAAALLILMKAGKLPSLVENFQADSYDTMLSVKLFFEHGPFGNAPVFGMPYSLFGNFPLLYAMLASILNLIINDVSMSTTLLYWATELGIAALLWGGIMKKCDWRVRAAFVALFLVNMAFGNIFPLGFRKRQQLAVLLGLAMFYYENRILSAALAFAAVLAQPFTGAALIFLKGADSLGKRDYEAVALLVVAAALSYPFYAGLISASSLEPAMSGCGVLTYQKMAGLGFLLTLAFISFIITNRSRLDALSGASAALALYYPAALSVYLLLKDAIPMEAAARFLFLASMPCNESILQVSAIGIAVLVGLRGFQTSRLTVSLIIVATVISMSFLATYLIVEQSMKPTYENALSILRGLDVSRVKTLEVIFTDYSGQTGSVPAFTFFPMQSYAILNGYDMEFVDEYSLPPQLSRGGSNVPMSRLPLEIYMGDTDACKSDAAELKAAGAQALFFIIDFDLTSRDGAQQERFDNQSLLQSCGLAKASGSVLPDGSVIILYKVV